MKAKTAGSLLSPLPPEPQSPREGRAEDTLQPYPGGCNRQPHGGTGATQGPGNGETPEAQVFGPLLSFLFLLLGLVSRTVRTPAVVRF